MFPFGRMSTAIQRYPSGRFGIVGSVPGELTEQDPRALSPGQRRSKVWNTEQDVIDALLAIGMTEFQLADCSWYQPSPIQAFAQALTEQPKIAEAPFALTSPVSKAKGKQESLF